MPSGGPLDHLFSHHLPHPHHSAGKPHKLYLVSWVFEEPGAIRVTWVQFARINGKEKPPMSANQTVVVGHKMNMAIVWRDTNGQPMKTPVITDAPPTWTDTTPTVGALQAAGDGLSASDSAIAAGSDVVTATAMVGGVQFAASQSMTVSDAPQVLGSMDIVATVV